MEWPDTFEEFSLTKTSLQLLSSNLNFAGIMLLNELCCRLNYAVEGMNYVVE